MAGSKQPRTTSWHVRTSPPRSAVPEWSHSDARGTTQALARRVGISLYGCEPDEAALFREVAPRFGVELSITEAAASESTAEFATGNRCISVGHKTRITNPALRALSDVGVSYISTRSTGYNHIDVDFARSLGVAVEGVAYSPDSVADYTLMLMLMAVRNARSTVTSAEAHDFRLQPVRGRELRDLTVGVIGTGRIGSAVIDRLQGFGCRVLAFDRPSKVSADYGELDELLRQSDILTLHTPLNDETKHLLNRTRLGLLKPGAFVINTGRGPLIDTEALVSELESGRLGGAALDVVEDEEGIFYTDHSHDPIDSELFLRLQRLPNVMITPHTAYYTDHALSDIVQNTLLNCLEFEGTPNA
ncbi:D-isomer specific 2-hydroxyacid dehydrogenase family protein [Humibacter sp. RRB41]|uniref:D-isomer specific 2-hydroxyacid dehydrogenase family protein n=1 Tax=Humibacter sp. RRB41 TaxID=2919946 RepID=UPI001FAAD496|nr:D-isomer specific 2-hydroxyacid dehydrogenase family protein [Humibacter sp. RRB41]